MKHLIKQLITLLLCLITTSAGAVKVFECEDEQGNRTFQDHCPPGTIMIIEKNISVGKREQKAPNTTANVTITFYTIPECDACDLARIYLKKQNLPFTEKDVSKDIELQKELQEKTNAVTVPVIMIGEKAIIGFNRKALNTELETAGFIKPETNDTEITETTK